MTKFNIISILLVSYTSLYGSSVSSDPVSSQNDQKIKYDLSEYFFHKNLDVDGGTIEYVIKYHNKDNPENVYSYPVKRVRNEGIIEQISAGDVVLQYPISEKSIEQKWPNSNEGQKWIRHANLNDVYADYRDSEATFTEKCTLENHLEELDLAIAANEKTVSKRVYKDVVHVYCESYIKDASGPKVNWKWNKYYAYGHGLIFMEGDWPINVGPFYAIAEYQ